MSDSPRTFSNPIDIALADAVLETVVAVAALEDFKVHDLDEFIQQAFLWREMTHQVLAQHAKALSRIAAYERQMQHVLGVSDDELRQMRES